VVPAVQIPSCVARASQVLQGVQLKPFPKKPALQLQAAWSKVDPAVQKLICVAFWLQVLQGTQEEPSP
jgi:hypothetical protein